LKKNQKSELKRSTIDHSKELLRFKRIKGQIEGVEKMISSQRYCSDILHQLRAIKSGISSIEASILETHVKASIINASQTKGENQTIEKIDKIIALFKDVTTKGGSFG